MLGPGDVPPSQNKTDPSDEPVGTGFTVAVSVTVCPAVAGFGETVSVVEVVVTAFTVTFTAADVETSKPPLPE